MNSSLFMYILLLILIILSFQNPVCSSKEQKCVNNVKINPSGCLKACDGLVVTSYSKLEQSRKLENLPSVILEAYDEYKKITETPTGQIGNYLTFMLIQSKIFIL